MSLVKKFGIAVVAAALVSSSALAQGHGPVYGSGVGHANPNNPVPGPIVRPNPGNYGGGNYGGGNYGGHGDNDDHGNRGGGGYGNYGGGAPGPVYGSGVGHANPYNPVPGPIVPVPGSYGNYPGNYNNYPGNYGGYYPRPVPIYNPLPVFRWPTYQTYQVYPSGPCTIYTNIQYNSVYTVTNAYGQTLTTTYDYSQAYQVAQNAEYSNQCSSINTVTNNYQQPNYCQIMPGGNSYGQIFYRVIDNQGRILRDSCSYQDASNEVQSNAQCYQE